MKIGSFRAVLWASAAALAVGVAGVAGMPSSDAVGAERSAVAPSFAEPVTRRLSPEQYQNIIHDVFGPSVKIGGRFDPNMRVDGLVEIGAGRVSVSPGGMEQFDVTARLIANQVMDEHHRELLMPCKPRSETEPDNACARDFLSRSGMLLFRRPLSDAELQIHVAAAEFAAKQVGNFYTGLSLSLAGLLTAPQFLFRQEVVERDPAQRGQHRLDAYSKASRLSFFLWNSGPDEQLLQAAQKGDLDKPRGLAREVDRMIASSRLEEGLRAFFSDMYQFEAMASLSKDPVIYPKFGAQIADNAREQTLRTVVSHVLQENGDYRDIFTTKKTYVTKALAAIYKVPFALELPNGSPDTWQPYEFAADDPRAGILMQVSFVALHSHPGRSSPTLRGKALREIMLCQKVPAPPGDVQVNLVQDTSNPVYKTARERLAAHANEPVCAGCHKITDPIGLALENFDGGGSFRTSENGVGIDTSGTMDGVPFTTGAELGRAVRNHPAVPSCLVDRVTAYALGRKVTNAESAWTEGLKKAFADEGYLVPALLRKIALSPEFYRVAQPKTELTMLTPVNSKMEDRK
ncbi:MAG: DUF1592 domain-containing protein [Vicinamibacterales bacterium]